MGILVGWCAHLVADGGGVYEGEGQSCGPSAGSVDRGVRAVIGGGLPCRK